MLKMAAGFGDFPPEIVACIAEVLDASHAPSLLAFAQTSKHHYAISSCFLFRTVKMTLGDSEEPERLREEVKKWEAMLLRNSAFTYVRRLIFYSADLGREMPENPYLALEPCERDNDPTHLRSCWDLYHNWWCPEVSESTPPLPSLRNDDWQSVVHLVGQLHGLTDIFYACVAQFPICLLETLRVKLPRCRLHHFNFRLRDPNGAYERALATAPCLYSIGDLDHVDDPAGRTLARCHAPHLRSVFVWPTSRTRRDAAVGNCDPPEGVGRDLVAALQHIELGRSGGDRDPESLSDFMIVSRIAFNDFSALRILKLYSPIDYQTLPPPENFPSLVNLSLTCIRSPMASSYWIAALVFIRNLSRLTTLQLISWNRSISVVPGLSPNLRKLQLSTHHVGADPLVCDHIDQLATLCPHLEELAVEMRRSRGDASEVALYRVLGRLPRLRCLTIELDASPAPLIQVVKEDGTVARDTRVEPWFDTWGAEYLRGMRIEKGSIPSLYPYRKGHLLDVFVNSAVDEELARSIFAVIDGAKRTIGGGGVIPLERLEVAAVKGNTFPPTNWHPQPWSALRPYFHDVLARKWLVRRDVNDNVRHVLHVRELCHINNCQCTARGTPQGWCGGKLRKAQGVDNETKELMSKGGTFAEVWRRLWPDRGDGRGWWDAWESWPLELGSEVQ
jgi:hypothetical protein